MISTSGTDGVLRFFSITGSTESSVTQIGVINNVIPKLSGSNYLASSQVAWHPSGSHFAVPTIDNSIAIFSREGFKEIYRIEINRDEYSDILEAIPNNPPPAYDSNNKHFFAISALKWSPNGDYIAIGTADGYTLIWSSDSKKVVRAIRQSAVVTSVDWNNKKNAFSFITNDGGCYIYKRFLALGPRFKTLPHEGLSSFYVRSQDKEDIESLKPTSISSKSNRNPESKLSKLFDTEASMNDEDEEEPKEVDDEDPEKVNDFNLDDDDWMEDDGGEYSKELAKEMRQETYKRKLEDGTKDDVGNDIEKVEPDYPSKRMAIPSELINSYISSYKSAYTPFQQGSTRWNNNRRYMTINIIGYIWSVHESYQNTITVSFFDRGAHRDYHFKDTTGYDLASLTKEAALFARSGRDKSPFVTDYDDPETYTIPKIFFRFHTGSKDNWEYSFSRELHGTISNISLSETKLQVYTSTGYVFTFTIGGSLERVTRSAHGKVITCASWDDYFLVVKNCEDNREGGLTYSIENGKNFEMIQKHDSLDVCPDSRLISVFFSELGDPCFYDSLGTLHLLMSWRIMFQATWVPVLDTRAPTSSHLEQYELYNLHGDRETKESILKSRRRFWPLGLNEDNKFLCLNLYRDLKEPELPLPNLEEFDLFIPVSTETEHEQKYLLQSVQFELMKDREAEEDDLEDCRLEMDKLLIRQLHTACAARKAEKAMALARLIHYEKSLSIASQIAIKNNLTSLAEGINKLQELKLESA